MNCKHYSKHNSYYCTVNVRKNVTDKAFFQKHFSRKKCNAVIQNRSQFQKRALLPFAWPPPILKTTGWVPKNLGTIHTNYESFILNVKVGRGKRSHSRKWVLAFYYVERTVFVPFIVEHPVEKMFACLIIFPNRAMFAKMMHDQVLPQLPTRGNKTAACSRALSEKGCSSRVQSKRGETRDIRIFIAKTLTDKIKLEGELENLAGPWREEVCPYSVYDTIWQWSLQRKKKAIKASKSFCLPKKKWKNGPFSADFLKAKITANRSFFSLWKLQLINFSGLFFFLQVSIMGKVLFNLS